MITISKSNLKHLEVIEEPYRKLIFVDFNEVSNSTISDGPGEFWVKIKGKDNFSLTCITTATNNATVEQALSLLKLVKTKVRNHMGLELLDYIVRKKSELQRYCKSFIPTDTMRAKFN